MASLQKHTASAVAAMLRHNERTLPSPSDGHIDGERAADNYYIPLGAESDPGHAWTRYKSRLDEVEHLNRKDVVHVASWVVTLPRDADDAEAFFAATTAFLIDRYGRDNAISAIVHQDETTPHLHFLFMPVQDERLCAKKVLDKKELREFHPDLQRHLQKFGINGTVTNGVTRQKKIESEPVLNKRRW